MDRIEELGARLRRDFPGQAVPTQLELNVLGIVPGTWTGEPSFLVNLAYVGTLAEHLSPDNWPSFLDALTYWLQAALRAVADGSSAVDAIHAAQFWCLEMIPEHYVLLASVFDL